MPVRSSQNQAAHSNSGAARASFSPWRVGRKPIPPAPGWHSAVRGPWVRCRSMAEVRATGRRAVGPIALLVAIAFLVPGTAEGRMQTLHLRYGPIALEPAGLVAHNTRVRTPPIQGFVTHIHAYAADAKGRPLQSDRVMLHHAVFRRRITPKYDREC